MNVIPKSNTNPDTKIYFLNWINQYKKNNKFTTKKKGKNKLNTLKKGNHFGAKKGNKYAINVVNATTTLKNNIVFEINDIFFSIYLLAAKRNSFSSLVKLSYPDLLIFSSISSICLCVKFTSETRTD